LSGRPARAVSRSLVRAYREGTAVRNGFVRSILTCDRLNGGGWESAVSKLGAYQNGGYWGTPTGWYVSALALTDPGAGADLATEYVRFLRQNLRPDGITQAWEWFNSDTGEYVNPLYAATVALPWLSLGTSFSGLGPRPAGILGASQASLRVGQTARRKSSRTSTASMPAERMACIPRSVSS